MHAEVVGIMPTRHSHIMRYFTICKNHAKLLSLSGFSPISDIQCP